MSPKIICSLPGLLIQIQTVATHGSIHFVALSSFSKFGLKKIRKISKNQEKNKRKIYKKV